MSTLGAVQANLNDLRDVGKAPREVQTQQSTAQALNDVSFEHFLLGLSP